MFGWIAIGLFIRIADSKTSTCTPRVEGPRSRLREENLIMSLFKIFISDLLLCELYDIEYRRVWLVDYPKNQLSVVHRRFCINMDEGPLPSIAEADRTK